MTPQQEKLHRWFLDFTAKHSVKIDADDAQEWLDLVNEATHEGDWDGETIEDIPIPEKYRAAR